MFKRHRSFSKALSFLCILSLVLSLVPPVGIWQSVKADDTTLYNGGIDSYNGQGRSYWLQQADKGSGTIPDKVFISSINKWVYFNCEIYAERRMVVYGEPWDVPDNKLVWNFKEDPNGYFHKNKDGTGPRGWFRYAGYTMNGDLYSDKEFPNDGDGTQPVEYANVLTWSEISQLDNFTKSKLAVADYDPSKVKDYQWNAVWNSRYNLKDLKSGQSLGELFSQFSNYTSPPDAFKQRAVFKSVDNQGSASVVIVHRKNGGLWYRTYSGMVIKQDPSKLSSDSVSITLDSYSYLVKLDQSGSVLKYDPSTNMSPSVNVFITGILTDNLGSYGADPYYEGLVTTRNDITSYKTIINYFKITHKDPETNEDVTIDLKKVSPNALIGEYVDAVPVSTDGNTVTFKTVSPGISISIPPNILFPGDNTVTISGKVRIELKDGRHIDASNSASTSFTIKVVPKLQKPDLELSVTPSYSEVVISNGQYNPSTIQHKVQPVKVSNMTVPAGWKVVRLDFVIDKNVNRVQSATTPDYSESYDTTATSITSFTQSKTFDYNTKYIQPGKTGTPAYYGKVRYVLKDPQGQYHDSPWSDVKPVQAEVTVKENSDVPLLSANSNDEINLDKNGNPTSYTVKISATANVGDTGSKIIQKWVFTAVHNENTSETGTSTVTTTSRNASTTISVPIATNKDRTTETFNVTATLWFKDGTSKKSNTVKVEVPVNVKMDINLDFSGPTQIVGNEGDTVTIPLKAVATIPNKNQTIKLWRVWIRQDTESLRSTTYQTTQDTATVTATKSYTVKLAKDMNGQTLTFIARAKAQPVAGNELDSGQKTLTVRLIVNTTDKPVPVVKPPAGDVTCEGLLDPMTVPATLNPFTGEVTPDTTTVKTGIRASISDTGGRTVARWELYVGRDTPSDLMATYYTRKTSIEIPIGSTDSKQYTVNNKDGLVKFAYKAVVYFTDGTYKEGTDEKVFAVSWSYQNHKPTCYVGAPGVVAQGDDIVVYVWGVDADLPYGDHVTTDITSVSPSTGINEYTKNTYTGATSDITIATFWSDTLTTYTIQGFARDKLGAGSFATANVTIVPAIPLPKIQTTGDLKVNRKITFDGSSSYSGSKRATILWNKAQWKIEPYSSLTANDIKLITPTAGVQSTSIIAKKEGQVKVTLTITNSYGNTQSTSIIVTVKPDEPPVASLTMPTKVIRDPADSSQATIQITSNSYSPDGDTIVKHAWFYAYDSNNDGNFDNETWYIRKSDGTWQAVGDWNAVQNFDIETVDTGNDTTITLKTPNVGKYKVALVVREGLDLTGISDWVSVYDLQKSNTFDWNESRCVAEVLNVAPVTALNSSKIDKKKVNIVILTDKTSQSDMDLITSKINAFKATLYSLGIDANVTVSNQRIVNGSTTDFKPCSLPAFFFFKNHLHFIFRIINQATNETVSDWYNSGLELPNSDPNSYYAKGFLSRMWAFIDFCDFCQYSYLPYDKGPLFKNVVDITDIVFSWYSTRGSEDWRIGGIGFIQKDGNKYSMRMDATDHSFRNAGDSWFWWVTSNYSNGQSYIFPSRGYPPIYLLDCYQGTNPDGIPYTSIASSTYSQRVQAYNNSTGSGDIISFVSSLWYSTENWITPFSLLSELGKIYVEAVSRGSFDIQGKTLIPSTVPLYCKDNNYIYFIKYMDWYYQPAYANQLFSVASKTLLIPLVTLNSIEALSYAPLVLSDTTENENYVIYLSDTQGNSSTQWGQYFALSSADKNMLALLLNYNYHFYAVSPSSTFDYLMPNTPQNVTLRQLANATDGKLYDSAGNAIAQLDLALNDIKAKYTNPQLTPDPVYVLADEEKVVYYPYWQDYENDPIINQRWRYEHDETVFDNSQGKAEFDGIWLNAPIEVFTKPGKYTVTFQVQDSPPPGTDDFDEYKLWSKLERQMVLYVHRRPIADFTAVYNKSTGKVTITDRSYDPDHQYNRADKGIIAWKWQYKTIDDSTWTDTTLSNLQSMTLTNGKVYLIKLEVQDCDGPNGQGVWSKPKIAMIDLSVANNPPVADFTIDSEILKGNQPSNLTDKSYDPDNDPITAWHWWIQGSDGSTNKDFGETTNNNISTIKSYIATMSEGSYRLALQVKDSNNNYSSVTSKWFKIYSPSKDTEPDVVNNPPTGTFTMTITNHRTKLKPTTTYSDPDGDPKNAEQWYIKFNGQTRYFDRLPDTLESAGYIYDGTYEIGYRVQDNPTSRSTKLKPLWSNWYVQTYYISTDITIQAWTEKFAKRARNMTEVPSIVKNTVRTSDFKLGEGIIVKAKTTGYVEKIEVWFDRVETRTPKEGKVTKVIDGYWECSIKNGTMTLVDLHTILYPEDMVNNREISYEAVKGKKPLPAPVFFTVPYSMNWSSDIFDPKLQPKFIISNNNSYVQEKWPDRYRDLWDGLYKWSDWPLGSKFSYAKAMEIYGRPPYLIKGDVLHIKLRAYKRNADGSYTTKEIDLPVNIVGSIEIGTGEIN